MSENPITAIRTMLLADTDVAAEVGTRVFGQELPRGQTEAMPQKCLVVTSVGGIDPAAYIPVGHVRLDVRCYGKTPREADSVWVDVYDALKYLERAVHGTTLLHSAQMEGGPRSLRDPDAGWPFTLSTWVLRYGEEAAA